MQIEEYRTRLEEFIESLHREYYLYYSGQKELLETGDVYSEFSDLFSLDRIREIRGEIEKTPPHFESLRKSLGKLHAFAVEHHLEQACAPLMEEIAEFESKSTFPWEGKDIHYTQIPVVLANVSESLRRRRLNEIRARALEQSNPLRKGRLDRLRAQVQALGYKTCLEAYQSIWGIDYRAFSSSLEKLIEATEARYKDCVEESFQRILGLPPAQVHRCDIGYWTRRPDYDAFFPKELMLPALFETLKALRIDPAKQENVFLDLEERPRKRARAFCVTVRVPQEIKVVVLPRGGRDDYAALLHESGHAQHFAWTSPSLVAEHRLCGDRGLSEAYAFLFEHLMWNERWLQANTGFFNAGEFLRFQALVRSHQIRRYCGKLQYEIQLHSEPMENPARVYVEALQRATGTLYDQESYLEDIDDGFYSADYLRAWIFEAQLRDYLRSRFGHAWFHVRAADSFLKEIWETGQLYSIGELSREIGIGPLDVQVLIDELLRGLRP